ncbi:hypothetical protein ACH36K_05155 [Clostridium sp. MB05]|uniref:hypothetical protein n=1 Tax=Clostridium sp. MB05 TaxID=3376682 RepID=UPI003981AC8F
MKKYLGKALFYQGDSNIFPFLIIIYIASFFINKSIISNWFNYTLKGYLYNDSYWGHLNKYIYNFEGLFFLVLYLIIVYIIATGIFKRKKWSTLLAGPFSRMDIRKREFIVLIISNIVYIFIYLIIIGQSVLENRELVVYIGNLNELILLDIIRIISISTIVIGFLCFFDSIFSNIYYFFGSLVFIFIYLVSILINIESSAYINYIYIGEEKIKGLRYLYGICYQYLSGTYYEIPISNSEIIYISISLILLGIIFIIIAKNLTNKMLVESMSEGIIFDFPKKIGKLMVITFPGLLLSPTLSELINEIYYYNLQYEELFFIRKILIFTISIATYFILRRLKGKKKQKIYK